MPLQQRQMLPLILAVLLLSLLLPQTMAATPAQAILQLVSTPSFEYDDFVRVNGTRFVDGAGRPFFAQGINYWSCMHLAADETKVGGDVARLRVELDQLQRVGVNVLRIMAASEGAPTPQPFRIAPTLRTSPHSWNEDVFRGLDRCISEAKQRDMRVIVVLGNTWQWTGGVAQYVSWANDDEPIPYPRGWDIHAQPQRTDGYAGWGAWVRQGDEENRSFMAFQARFYTDAQAQALYRQHVERVMDRTNTVTGQRYVDDPAILAWEPINEPQTSDDVDDARADPMIQWHHRTSDLIKRLAPKQLSTTGFEAKQGKERFVALHDRNSIDFACAHLWAEIWGEYDMLNASEANVLHAMSFATRYLTDVQRWSHAIGKPVILEEFGIARDNWNNANRAYVYSTSAPTTHRDAYFAHLFDIVWRSYTMGSGWAGLLPWSYGGNFDTATQCANSYGMLFAGDPPQEPPGWFSILYNDNTMSLFDTWHVRRRNQAV